MKTNKGAAKKLQGSSTGFKGGPNGDLGERWGYKIQEIVTIPKKSENAWLPGLKGAAKELQGSPTAAQGAPNGDPGECWGYKIQEILTLFQKAENSYHPGLNISSKPPLMEPKGVPRESHWSPRGAPAEIWESPGGIKSRK